MFAPIRSWNMKCCGMHYFQIVVQLLQHEVDAIQIYELVIFILYIYMRFMSQDTICHMADDLLSYHLYEVEEKPQCYPDHPCPYLHAYPHLSSVLSHHVMYGQVTIHRSMLMSTSTFDQQKANLTYISCIKDKLHNQKVPMSENCGKWLRVLCEVSMPYEKERFDEIIQRCERMMHIIQAFMPE